MSCDCTQLADFGGQVREKKGHDGEKQTCHRRFCCTDNSDLGQQCSCGHHGRAYAKLGFI